MAITKTNFINYSRCPRYVALKEIKKERLNADISYKEYIEEELDEKVRELIDSMYDIDEDGNEEDLIDLEDPQLEVMMPYYKKIEELAGKKVEEIFKGKSIYAESTFSQESFDFIDNGIKYLCYVDIYNENEDINIIEVKATTSKKYLEDLKTGYRSTSKEKHDKYSLFYKDNRGIYNLKEELNNWNMLDEMPLDNYKKNRNKLMDRFSSVGKYIHDLAVQRMIIEKSGVKKANYYLAVLNHEYVFDGTYKNSNPEYKSDIISVFDFTKITEEMQELVLEEKKTIEKYIMQMNAEPCNIGNFCEYKLPSKCKFCKICFKHIPKSNSSLSYMNNGYGFKDEFGDVHKGLDLINEGYLNMLDIPESWIKNPNHKIQRECLITHKPYINKKKINIAIKNLKYPIYHLDFETFPCPLPRFNGEKCYSQSPFQFSLHIENEPGKCDKEENHYGFLSKDFNIDCREELASKLCEYIDTNSGTVFAQNVSFEKSRLKELSEIFPEYKNKLIKMLDMASDLLYIVRNNSKLYLELGLDEEEAKTINYYHEDLSGSYSIKKTLPVFGDLKYSDLDVTNGTEALVTYATFPKLTKEEYNKKYNSLIEYCKQDTWAMVLILNKLISIVK
jgi:hypothetical protein